MNYFKVLYGLDIPYKSLNYKNLKMAVTYLFVNLLIFYSFVVIYYWVIQNDCGQVWQLCTKIYVATVWVG
jgi:hypothetical protein